MKGIKNSIKGFGTFLFVALVTIAITLLAYAYLSIKWIDYKDSLSPLSKPSEVQALTGLIALVLTAAAAIGGAIATLWVASLGLEVSLQQQRRDYKAFIDSKRDECITIFAEISWTLGQNHYAMKNFIEIIDVSLTLALPLMQKDFEDFDQNIESIISENFQQYVNDELKQALTYTFKQSADNIFELFSLFKKLLTNDLARSCYYSSCDDKKKSKCIYLTEWLVKSGSPPLSYPDMKKIPDIAALLRDAEKQMRDDAVKMLTNIVILRARANKGGMLKDRDVQALFFLGILISRVDEKLFIKSENTLTIVNYGAAIFHDFYNLIPSGRIIQNEIEKHFMSTEVRGRYNDLLKAEENYYNSFDFDHKLFTLTDFDYAITESDKTDEAYLLTFKLNNPL